jgi:hypothetical protein
VSNLWFNLRVLLWHLQIEKGRLFLLKVAYNPWWWRWALLWKPVWLCECSPREGWRERNNKAWTPYTTGATK